MTDDIDIRKVDNDKTAIVISNFIQRRGSDFVDGHFRGFIKQRDIFPRGNNDSFFSGKQLLFFAVEEKSHMHRFFRFGDLCLLQIMAGKNVA